MRGGDLSNEPAKCVGMRFERVIKTEEGQLNRSAKAYLESITRMDVNVYLLTTGDSRRCMAFCTKWGVPFTRVISADSTLEIPSIVNEGQYLYYYDADTNILANVRARSRGVEAIRWTSVETT